MSSHRKKRAPPVPLAGDLLRSPLAEEVDQWLAEEQRLAGEAEDQYFAEFGAEIEAHPIGHGGMPHGCT